MPSHSFASPVGTIEIAADGERLRSLSILDAGLERAAGAKSHDPLLAEARRQIEAYFARDSESFDLPLAPASTPRGEELRAAIAAIAYGDTASYGELARRFASGARAIGQACRRNPFPLVIPCHRVIGAEGTMGHYSGGRGLATKSWLLEHEAGHVAGSDRGQSPKGTVPSPWRSIAVHPRSATPPRCASPHC